MVEKFAGLAIQNQKARRLTPRGRTLCYLLMRKVVVQFVKAHGVTCTDLTGLAYRPDARSLVSAGCQDVWEWDLTVGIGG